MGMTEERMEEIAQQFMSKAEGFDCTLPQFKELCEHIAMTFAERANQVAEEVEAG